MGATAVVCVCVSFYVGSWNVNGKKPIEELDEWLRPMVDENNSNNNC